MAQLRMGVETVQTSCDEGTFGHDGNVARPPPRNGSVYQKLLTVFVATVNGRPVPVSAQHLQEVIVVVIPASGWKSLSVFAASLSNVPQCVKRKGNIPVLSGYRATYVVT